MATPFLTMPNLTKLWKSTPLIAAVGAAAMLAVGIVVAIYSENTYRVQKSQAITVQAKILADTVAAALVFDDAPAAQEYVNALKANPQTKAVGVYKADGKLFVGYSRGPVTFPDHVRAAAPFFKDGTLRISTAVMQNGQTIGYVYIRNIAEPLSERLARFSGFLLLVSMATLLLAVLVIANGVLNRVNRILENRNLALNNANNQLVVQMEERAKAEEALRQSQKMEAIGQLSGGIAHDFNNLLTVIKGNLQLLDRRIAAGQTDLGRYIDAAMDGVMRAANVTQRILAFSRRQPLSPKPVNLSRLILDVAEILPHSVGPLVHIETHLKSDYLVLCDENQMENVILNLAVNARDAMPQGGHLIIETRNIKHQAPDSLHIMLPYDMAEGDYVRLTVQDTGAGMSEEIRQKAIEPFFTTKPVGQGTGLGLSMIFGYIKQSGGHLHIESELGHGTCITIFMPRYLGAANVEEMPLNIPDASTAARAFLSDKGPSKPRVLIVEDEPLVRALVAETFEEKGYEVMEEGDGQAAYDVLTKHPEIDLLVSDVKLPGLTGYQLATGAMQIRPKLKILLVTGYAQDPVPNEITKAGIDILYKPYRLEELLAKANQMIAERPAV